MVYELAVGVTYYNLISNKWQVKVLGFKAVIQNVNHLLFVGSNAQSSRPTLRNAHDFLLQMPSFATSSSKS